MLATTANSVIYVYDTRWCMSGSARREAAGGASSSSSAAAAGGGTSGGAYAAAASGGGSAGGGEPAAQFSGHRIDSFYVKTTFSPDGRYIASGSSDHGVYVWEVDRPDSPPVVLWGHSGEATAVAWSPIDMTTLVSAADDSTCRVWRVDREGGAAARQLAALRRGYAVEGMQTPRQDRPEATVPQPSEALVSPLSPAGTHLASDSEGAATTTAAAPAPTTAEGRQQSMRRWLIRPRAQPGADSA